MRAPYYPNPEFYNTNPASRGVRPGKMISMEPSITDGSTAPPLVDEARGLWEGWRSMEEYAREVFPIEEEANGLDWML